MLLSLERPGSAFVCIVLHGRALCPFCVTNCFAWMAPTPGDAVQLDAGQVDHCRTHRGMHHAQRASRGSHLAAESAQLLKTCGTLILLSYMNASVCARLQV